MSTLIVLAIAVTAVVLLVVLLIVLFVMRPKHLKLRVNFWPWAGFNIEASRDGDPEAT